MKHFPCSADQIEELTQTFPTPFYLYDEKGIRRRTRELAAAFSWNENFRNYFAVKATPNPHLLAALRDEGCGADCSSVAELVLCKKLNMTGSTLMFTSNNTTWDEFQKAIELGAIINLDDPAHVEKLKRAPEVPEFISFRFNPGAERTGNAIIGEPTEAKFGCTRDQLLEGYEQCQNLGVTRFGLHTMVVSNERNVQSFFDTARMLFELAVMLYQKLGIKVEFINLGGGIGIPYRPEETELNLLELGKGVQTIYAEILGKSGIAPVNIYMENGRAITGPFGYLVTQVINVKNTYKRYVGVDACMSNLMRPAMYGAYHHLSVLGKEDSPNRNVVDVVGSLCENNDKFAIDRELPDIDVGDIMVIHDAGAHGHSMGFQYNGRLRSAELLLCESGEVRLIRRAEELKDYFATLEFPATMEN